MSAVLAVVLANAHVLTMNPAQPHATTVAVLDGKIAYVGDDLSAARKAVGGKPDVIDLGGRTLMPGFDDAHVHFGLSLTIGSDHGVDIPELGRRAWVAAVKKASAAHPDGWLFIKTRALPDGVARSADVDFVSRPLFVVTARGGLLNKPALQAGHFTADEAPHGFVRGRELAAALDRLVKALPLRTLTDGARDFLALLAKNGITSAQLISDELAPLFEGFRQRGALTARIRMVPLGYRFETRLYEPTWAGPQPEWVRVDGVKYFHDDGARITRYELQQIFERSLKAARPVVVHVLSQRALDTLLDALEALTRASSSSRRPDGANLFRVDHADEVTPAQAERLKKLGIVVCSNPSMLPEWRTDHAFPMHTLVAAGVRTCIGTDWVGAHQPPRPLAPLQSVQLAVTHGGYGEAERITVAQALEAYTVGSAAAEGTEELKGSLAPGKLADLVVLSADPERTPADQLGTIEVVLTMAGGRVVHHSGDLELPALHRPPPPTTIGPEPAKRPPSIGPVR